MFSRFVRPTTLDEVGDAWQVDTWTLERHLEDAGIEPIDYLTDVSGLPVPRYDGYEVVRLILENDMAPIERIVRFDLASC